MNAIKRRSALIIVWLAAAAVVAASASADGTDSAVTMKAAKLGPSFHGRVISNRAFCEHHRKVWLVGVYPDGSHPIEFDFSNDHGKWRLSAQLQGASAVFARAARKRGNGVHCGRAGSATIPTL